MNKFMHKLIMATIIITVPVLTLIFRLYENDQKQQAREVVHAAYDVALACDQQSGNINTVNFDNNSVIWSPVSENDAVIIKFNGDNVDVIHGDKGHIYDNDVKAVKSFNIDGLQSKISYSDGYVLLWQNGINMPLLMPVIEVDDDQLGGVGYDG